MKKLLLIWMLLSAPLFGQANQGELQLTVTDPAGLAVKTAIHLVSQANHYAANLDTNPQGRAIAQRLPFGRYQLDITEPGFAPISELVEIRSSIPLHYVIQLKLSSVQQSVTVATP
jgi:hypothetical protein